MVINGYSVNTVNYFSGVTYSLLVWFSLQIMSHLNLIKMSQLRLKIIDQLIRIGMLKSPYWKKKSSKNNLE